MVPILATVRAHYAASGDGLIAHVRSERYARYPRYGIMLALLVCLFDRLPFGAGALNVLGDTPAAVLLVCVASAVAAGLATAMSMIGAGRPGRANLVLALAAVVLCISPWLALQPIRP
jgi:hypothetical protein